ncbi:MAG: hypothetical protein JXR70_02340 [Spirochaetales bacterium]|nr:hypothetical protein [Spirochaetales bacterium]
MKKFIFLLFFINLLFTVFSQELPVFLGNDRYALEHDRLQLAISTIEYPVTPGDVYQLSYLSAGTLATYEIVVESDYNVELNVFGHINGYNKSFPELKKEIEAKVIDAYPGSIPFVSIESVGIFQVFIVGELDMSQRITVWGLTRLSQAISGLLQSYSSIRNIQIHHSSGEIEQFDLYKSIFEGDLDQDPLLKPGDIIHVDKSVKNIRLVGQVHRPGEYQILSDDSLIKVINYYGRGFTEDANLKRIKITHNTLDDYNITYLDSENKSDFANYIPKNGDIIELFSVSRIQKVVYIEGAISSQQTDEIDELNTLQNQVNRISYSFNPGITLYDVLQNNISRISTYADLKSVYIIEENSTELHYVDCASLLFQYSSEKDRLLHPFDIIVIPEIEFRVNVIGAVYSEGVFSYVRGKTAMYYIIQAGGIDTELNTNFQFVVRGKDGKNKSPEDVIEAGDTIIVLKNSFSFSFGEYAPVITSILAMITTVIAFVNLFGNSTD